MKKPSKKDTGRTPRKDLRKDSAAKTWSASTPLWIGSMTLALLLGGFGAWSVFTQITGAVIAPGRIEVDRNRQVVQHPDGGVVTEINVNEGDLVETGEVLIRLDDTALRSQLAIVESQLHELMARRGRLEAERDDRETPVFDKMLIEAAATSPDALELMQGQKRLAEARATSLSQEIEQLSKRRSQIENQIEGIDAQRDALGEQLELIEGELTDQQSLLDRGLAQASRVLALRREDARLRGTLGELTAQRAQSEGRSTEIDLEIIKLRARRREEAITRLRDLRYRELELAEERRALIERLARLDVTAPVSGRVYGLQVFAERAVLRPADPVLYLVPQDRPLVIAARVQPIDIDLITLDQPVRLRFSAFDQRDGPELLGHIRQISADAFTDEASGMSYYMTEIVLETGEITKLPEGAELVPGMPVEAFITTGDRTPLAYLLDPVLEYTNRAFREN
ncbi:HlyD family type I secretion periplasmic adaptor subunit [Pseudooceanicola atlanticus]|uniref:HlyD family type I secretion periplasmic adaptor subunit n=1 Tax=Pseudooceanicola atlanticus TaxID=1461694 RepID=UPI0009DE67C0